MSFYVPGPVLSALHVLTPLGVGTVIVLLFLSLSPMSRPRTVKKHATEPTDISGKARARTQAVWTFALCYTYYMHCRSQLTYFFKWNTVYNFYFKRGRKHSWLRPLMTASGPSGHRHLLRSRGAPWSTLENYKIKWPLKFWFFKTVA